VPYRPPALVELALVEPPALELELDVLLCDGGDDDDEQPMSALP
jgi:hypothetical protein